MATLDPGAAIRDVAPEGAYVSQPFFTGFLGGYHTMDALASLAFGIVVVQTMRGLGVTEPDAAAGSTVRAGIFSCLFVAGIYIATTVVGVQSRGLFETSANGGIALAQIAQHYLGGAGLFILAATVTLACLKTSVGLITSCAEAFRELFPKGPDYRVWAVGFSLISLLLANFGLSSIIAYSVPVLMFLYPLSITLILLSLFGRFFQYDRAVFVCTTALTLVGALYDFAAALPASLLVACHLDGVLAALRETLPLVKLGLFWVCPALLGLVIGLVVHFARPPKGASGIRMSKYDRIASAVGGGLLLAGVLLLALKGLSAEYVDASGMLHERFFLLPLGFLCIFCGFLVFITIGARTLIRKFRSG